MSKAESLLPPTLLSLHATVSPAAPFRITHKLLVASLPQSLPLSQGLGSLRADPPSEDGGKEGIESSAFSGSFVTMSPW